MNQPISELLHTCTLGAKLASKLRELAEAGVSVDQFDLEHRRLLQQYLSNRSTLAVYEAPELLWSEEDSALTHDLLKSAKKRIDIVLLEPVAIAAEIIRPVIELETYFAAALSRIYIASQNMLYALPSTVHDAIVEYDCVDRCDITVTSTLNGKTKATPEMASVKVGSSITWFVDTDCYPTRDFVRWVVYFSHHSPFESVRGTPWLGTLVAATQKNPDQRDSQTGPSRDRRQKDSQTDDVKDRHVIIGPVKPVKQGRYKYGIKSQDPQSGSDIDDDDPVLDVLSRYG